RLRRAAGPGSAGELGVHAAGPVVLDQQHYEVALANDAALVVALHDLGRRAERRRRDEIDAVLAAVTLAVALGDRRDVGLAHARLERAECRAHRPILHARRAYDELLLLRALDHLDLVDEIAGIDEFRI